jgi:hypothetical protein
MVIRRLLYQAMGWSSALKYVMHINLGTPKLKQLTQKTWRLTEPFNYVTLAGKHIIVPTGFETDGASTPFGKVVTPWGGHYGAAVLIHDWLYDRLNAGRPDPAAPTRKAADKIFLEICKRSGVKPLVRLSMWFALRMWGANPLIKKIAIS